ncbi:MAG: uracil-DNA glycosylase family protein [Patescibacteria group bacterium]
MKEIRDEVLNLTDSPLYEDRLNNKTYPVLGEGSHDADIMFIGEAPGKNEAEQGRPFCGPSGRILDELLDHISFKRDDVYITNVVKDRPPSNRDPSTTEIEIYSPFLDRQIDILEPKVIATLGRHAMIYALERYGVERIKITISEAHGKRFKGISSYGELLIVPLFHPAVAVYDASKKEDLKKDFEVLKEISVADS